MSISYWTPPFGDGWYPKLSPDGKYLLCGNAIGRVIEIATKAVTVIPGERWIAQGWFNPLQACVAGPIAGRWVTARIDAPLFNTPYPIGPSLNFMGAGGNIWAGGNTQQIWAGDPDGHGRQLYPRPNHQPPDPPPGYAATVDEQGFVAGAVEVHTAGKILVWKDGALVRTIIPAFPPNVQICGAGGYVGYGYYGPSWLNRPDNVNLQVNVTDAEGPPLAFRHLGSVWLATTNDNGVYLRPLGVRDRAITISIPYHDPYGGAVSCSVVSMGTYFLVASADAKGRLTLNEVPANTIMLPVIRPEPPKPIPPPEVIPTGHATIDSYETPIELDQPSRAVAKILDGKPSHLRWFYLDNKEWITVATNPVADTDHHFNTKPHLFPAIGHYPIRLQALYKDAKGIFHVLDQTGTPRTIDVREKVILPPDPPIDPPEPPEPEPEPGTAVVSVRDNTGAPIAGAAVWHQEHTDVVVLTDDRGLAALPIPGIQSGVCSKKAGYHSPGLPDQDHTCVLLTDHTVSMILQPFPPPRPPGTVREGLVRALGKRHFADDIGQFWPLGQTLFWAMRGWKYERDRLKRNIDYVLQYDFDYIRVLAQVGWTGNEISEAWPDHVQILSELMDYCWSLGLRTQVTGIGGGSFNPDTVIDHVIAACKPRPHAVHSTEVANEYKGNFDNESKMKALGDRLKANLPNLVALSDPGVDAVDSANKAWVPAHATLGMAHMDRSDNTNEWKWRHIRKGWEAGNDPHCQSSHNEPGGPRSSVAEFPEALHCAMIRAVAIICGWEDHCFHNAAGVQGIVDPAHNRPANLWEVPGIDDAMKAVRGVDQILPTWLSDGQATRGGDSVVGPHPLNCDAFWPSRNLDHGVTRDYARVNGPHFAQALQGIKSYVNVKARVNYHVTVTDPITHAQSTFDVAAGQSHRVESQSRDSRGYGGLILTGTQY